MSQLAEYQRCDVTCDRCGNTFVTRSTRRSIHVSACNKCHDYFVGGNTGFRKPSTQVERFNRRYNKESN